MHVYSDEDMASEDWLSILHALVLLASDTSAGRAALRSAHDMDEALRTELRNLKKRVTKTQKEIKQNDKAAKAATKEAKDAEKQNKSGAVTAVAKADSAQKETIYMRSRGENPRDTLARDREQVAVLEKQLQAIQVSSCACTPPVLYSQENKYKYPSFVGRCFRVLDRTIRRACTPLDVAAESSCTPYSALSP